MRKIVLLLCSCLLILSPAALTAQNSAAAKLPTIIRSGLEAYKNAGPQSAIQAWIKGSPLDGNKLALSQANNLNQIQDFYGAYRSFDIISTHDVTPRIKTVYLALNFEKGPVFGKFVLYRADSTWILTSFNFNTKEEAILPYAPLGP